MYLYPRYSFISDADESLVDAVYETRRVQLFGGNATNVHVPPATATLSEYKIFFYFAVTRYYLGVFKTFTPFVGVTACILAAAPLCWRWSIKRWRVFCIISISLNVLVVLAYYEIRMVTVCVIF